ncbi:MAG: isoprenylcysteine carboxylmethyltransferase family protein, partial [Cyanobacteria bacterium P01_H01_bin.153]
MITQSSQPVFDNRLKRVGGFIYGLICYFIFFGTFLYAIGFVGNLVVPKTIDAAPTLAFPAALAINVG